MSTDCLELADLQGPMVDILKLLIWKHRDQFGPQAQRFADIYIFGSRCKIFLRIWFCNIRKGILTEAAPGVARQSVAMHLALAAMTSGGSSHEKLRIVTCE